MGVLYNREKIKDWDGLALIQRGDEQFINEPHVGNAPQKLCFGGEPRAKRRARRARKGPRGNPVASSKGTSYFNDALGTTIGSKQGGKYSAAALTAFGEDLTVHSPTPTQNSNFFTGKPMVEGLGHAFLMRNYRAGLAKWQTADPMGYPDGWNQLAYCGNGVTSVVDLWGCVRTHAKHSVGTQEALWTCEQVSWLKYGVTFYGYCDGKAIDYNKEEVKAINGSASGLDTSGITGPLPSREVLEAALNGLEWCEKAAVYKKFSWYEVPNSRKTGKISLSFEVVLTCELTLSYWLTSIVYDKDGNPQKIRTEETGPFTIELTRKTVTFKCKE